MLLPTLGLSEQFVSVFKRSMEGQDMLKGEHSMIQ